MTFLFKIEQTTLHRLPLNEQDASLDALTLKLPRGLYTTFRTFHQRTRALGLTSHLNRLYRLENVTPQASRIQLRQAIAEALVHFPAEEARVRLQVDTTENVGALYLMIEPLHLLAPEIYQNGVAVQSTEIERNTPSLKTTAFIEQSAQARQSKGPGIFEILLTHHGRVLEGMTSNFYWIQQGGVRTAGRGVLAGVTRQLVLKNARALGIPILFKTLELKHVGEIDEAFITSSSRGVVPVVKIDNAPVGEGRPGALTMQLMQAYEQNVARLAMPIAPARRGR